MRGLRKGWLRGQIVVRCLGFGTFRINNRLTKEINELFDVLLRVEIHFDEINSFLFFFLYKI